MPKLVLKSGTAGTAEYDLKPGVNCLGRGPLNDFRLDDPSVSAAHAEITVEANCVTVKDLRSTNGTFINRSQIREGFLQPGQVLSLGGVEMLYVAEEVAAAAGPGAVARTIALPQVGGIKITRPTAAPQMPGGFQLPNNYPVPTGPAPNLTTAPTPFTPAPAQPAPIARQTQAQVQAPLPAPAEDRTWKNVPVSPTQAGRTHCLGFGLCAAVVSGLIWILVSTAGISPGPIGLAATGLICGLTLRIASRNASGAAYSLLAVGCALVGMFIGEFGQVFTGQKIVFTDFSVLALAGGVLCAALLGGVGFAQKSAAKSRYA